MLYSNLTVLLNIQSLFILYTPLHYSSFDNDIECTARVCNAISNSIIWFVSYECVYVTKLNFQLIHTQI